MTGPEVRMAHRHGWTTGRRGSRQLLRDPLQLAVDLLFLIITLVYLPWRKVLSKFFSKPKSLQGKVCMVTGSGRGLGREVSLALAREGAIVACTDINEETNNKTCEIIRYFSRNVKGYKLNVAKKDEVDRVVKEIQNDLGPIDVLVNNASIIFPTRQPSEECTRAIFNVNTLGPIWTTSAVLPTMKHRNAGHIVNISSIAGLYGTPALIAYGASKAALSNYSQSLRLELSLESNNKINVTCIHPDIINTSADYVEMINSRLSPRELMSVTSDVIDAIKYNKTDISSPSIYYYLFALNVLIPSEIIHKFIKLLGYKLISHSVQELLSESPLTTEEMRDSERLSGRKARKITFTTKPASPRPLNGGLKVLQEPHTAHLEPHTPHLERTPSFEEEPLWVQQEGEAEAEDQAGPAVREQFHEVRDNPSPSSFRTPIDASSSESLAKIQSTASLASGVSVEEVRRSTVVSSPSSLSAI